LGGPPPREGGFIPPNFGGPPPNDGGYNPPIFGGPFILREGG